MGSMCGTQSNVERKLFKLTLTVEIPSSISKERDLVITPSSFVKKNEASFHSLYKLEKFPLGYGARGEVRLCTFLPTNALRVAKIILKSNIPKKILGSVFEEVTILKDLDHPNLPRIFEFFEDETHFYIVLEYCKGGDLFDRISQLQKFEETQAAEIMLQLLSGVNYLHSKGIAHRDIKPENILMEEKDGLSLKIIDFDTATFFGAHYYREMHGTPLYMAPEVIKGRYNEKCDIWSCGMIFYILLNGGPPYDADTDAELFKIIKSFKLILTGPQWERISENAKDLLSKLLEKDPNKRISAAEACVHPWFSEYTTNASKEDISAVLEKIKLFRRTSKLKEAMHTFILSKIVDPKIFETEEKVFRTLDVNKDGCISKDELMKVFAETLPDEEAEMYADMIIEQIDSNVGDIDFTGFLRATVPKNKVFTKNNLTQAFKIIDEDGSGTIEKDELKKCLSSGDAEVTEELVEEIMQQADKNGDGKIDLYEFQALLLENMRSRNSFDNSVSNIFS